MSALLERHHPEPGHCEVVRPVPSLTVVCPQPYARYPFTAGWTRCGERSASKSTSSQARLHSRHVQ